MALDSLYIGCIGFAQMGQPDYYEKQRTERKVIFDYLARNLPVPDEFISIARYKWVSNSHDFGEYHDLQILFNERELSFLGEDEVSRFWDWANQAEEIDFESDQFMKACLELHLKLIADKTIVPASLKKVG